MIEETNPYRNTIKLNQEIVSVTKTDKYKFDVFTKNGSIYSAKHVLVIFSTGVLNARTIKCQPELSVWKCEALVLAPMSHYCKLFLLFTERFLGYLKLFCDSCKTQRRVLWQKPCELFWEENGFVNID